MNNQLTFLLLVLLPSLFSCTKKEVDIDFKQKACQKLRINSPVYYLITDPSCGAPTDSAIVKVVFKHPQQKDCIEKIFPDPVFYDTLQKEIADVTFSKTLLKDEDGVAIYEDSASFILRAKFATRQDANRLNNIHLKFHTENKLGDKSKETKVRINGKCAKVLRSSYNVKDTVAVTTETVTVTFYDDASEDGDVISVYLNGVWVMENFQLTNNGNTFIFQVNKGYNDLVIFAVNQGKEGPNTCAVSVNGGAKIDMRQDLKTGDALSIKFE